MARLDDKPDQGMLQKKGGRGFPYCIFMDAKGTVLGEARPSNEKAVTDGLADAKDAIKIIAEAEAKPDDALAQATYKLFMGLKARDSKPEDMKKWAATKGMSKKLQDKYKAWHLSHVVNSEQSRLRKLVRSGEITREEFGAKMGEAIYKKMKAGMNPSWEGPTWNAALNFYYFAATGAEAAKDYKALARCVECFEACMKNFDEKRQKMFAERDTFKLKARKALIAGDK